MAELKGRVAFLKTLNTQRGMILAPYTMQAPQEYEAQLSAVDTLAVIRQAEARIDALQDVLDAHNATTTIDVDDRLTGDEGA